MESEQKLISVLAKTIFKNSWDTKHFLNAVFLAETFLRSFIDANDHIYNETFNVVGKAAPRKFHANKD